MRSAPTIAAVCLVLGVAGVASAQGKSATAKNKITVCHTKGNGSYAPLSVSASALPAHLGHGDVLQPNGSVPGSPGYVFDSSCQAVTWDYQENAVLDASAQTSSGNLLVGSGIPASGFGIAVNQDAGIELGLGVIYRQGPSVLSVDDYSDGELHFDVASGPQSTANGSFVNNAARAAWSFNFSVATGLFGSGSGMNDFTIQLLYDVDPGPGTTFRTLTLEPGGGGSSGYQWRDQALALSSSGTTVATSTSPRTRRTTGSYSSRVS